MKLIYFDIDTLRPDHLGCYGYPRATSPTIDALAAEGVRFDRVYASDTPCLPSRTALCTGQFGIRSGVVNHGGSGAELVSEGPRRRFQTAAAETSWASALRRAGAWTASISTFSERHSAYHFDAGFNECFNLGTRGMETADQVAAVARDWLARNAHRPSWFLHVHMWDPHTPYRTPPSFGDAFEDQPVPDWLTEEVRRTHWDLPGPHSAQEVAGFEPRAVWDGFPRQPQQIAGPGDLRRMFDGYDVAVRFADHHLRQIIDALDQAGVADETGIMVSSDHGENLGELGIYCDHQTADEHTAHLPVVLRWPGVVPPGRTEGGLHYQFDVMATVIELFGATVPAGWDGMSFAPALRSGQPTGRSHLVLSHAAWTAQRSVRFGDWLCIRTYFDAYHGFPGLMLFDVGTDPHEQRNRVVDRADVAHRAVSLLDEWEADGRRRSPGGIDPLWTTLREGGPWHARVDVDWYLNRLRATGRAAWADHFDAERRKAAPSSPPFPGPPVPSRVV